MTSFGIDTVASHLNAPPSWLAWSAWNGGAMPAFAARNFLGGKFLWAHGEATKAYNSPSPDDLSALLVLVPLIAPMQAANTFRQAAVGQLGTLYGKIDADALCRRMKVSIETGELALPDSELVQVYLQVDPAANFSADYWSAWADMVTNFSVTVIDHTNPQEFEGRIVRPFRPCIRCAFTVAGPEYDIDAHVPLTLHSATTQHPELNSVCWGLWADAADLDDDLQKPNPTVDWSKLEPTDVPIYLWRFTTKFVDDNSTDVATSPDWPFPLAADAVNDVGDPPVHATDFMLVAQKWQSSVKNIVNYDLLTEQNTNQRTHQIQETIQA